MARRKKASAVLSKAEKRLSGLKSINPKLDLGNGITLALFEKEIVALRQTVETYNTLLSKVDDASNAVKEAEKGLSVVSENVLLSVKVKYGKDSSEYEMAGGTRASERRRRRTAQSTEKDESQPLQTANAS